VTVPTSSGDVLGEVTSARALATLRRLELAISRRLDGLVHGDYLGLTPGGGREAAEAREYRPGEDDVRRMDWAVTARTTIPHIREETADHELETWILVDATASMDFGTSAPATDDPAGVPLEKRDLALAAVAALGLLTARGGNRVGALVLTGQGLRRVPARSGRPALLALLRLLLAQPRLPEPTGPPVPGPSLPEAIDDMGRALAHRGRRTGLVAVVSDFLDTGAPNATQAGAPGWADQLRRLGARAPLLAVEVMDPRELELLDVGMLAVIDPETGARREVWTGSRSLRRRYAAAAAEQRAGIRAALAGSGARHLQLRTDHDWLREIARFVLTSRSRPLRTGGRR
jgi:uncharacterized protein (DUF58 family)